MSLIKQSSSLKWNYHNKGNKNSNKPNWIHQPEALKNGHVAYLIKVSAFTFFLFFFSLHLM